MKRVISLVIVLLIWLLPTYAGASEYSQMRDASNENNSDVYDSFMSGLEIFSGETSGIYDENYTDISGLIDSFIESSARDPYAGLIALYPVVSPEELDRLGSLDESEVSALLSGEISENTILALALARSPMIDRAIYDWQASLNTYPQELYLQDLLSQFYSFTGAMNLGIGEEYQTDMIQMHWSQPGMLALRGDAVELDIEIAWRDILREGAEVIADVKTMLAEIRQMDEMISINRASVGLLGSLKQVAQVQYISGTRSFSDLVSIETEMDRRADTLHRSESMRDGILAQLAGALDLPPSQPFGGFAWTDETEMNIPLDGLVAMLPETRGELLQMSAKISKMDVMIGMAGLQADPDQTFGFTYSQPVNADPMNGSMNSPMLDYRDYDYSLSFAWRQELIESRQAMQSMYGAELDMAQGMLGMLFQNYTQMSASSEMYRGRIIPEANAALQVVRNGYAVNENSFSELISAELALLMAKMELTNIELDRRKAYIDLERTLGADLIYLTAGESHE